MSVIPLTMTRRDDTSFEMNPSSPRIIRNGRDDPARDEWDAFEDLRETDNDHYNQNDNRGYHASNNHFVADDERSQFTNPKGKKAFGHAVGHYEAPKPVVSPNKWSIITSNQRITQDERTPIDDHRRESREVGNNFSNSSEDIFNHDEDIFNNDNSFEETEPVPEVPLPFSYLQLQSQANDMFVHLDVAEGCVESKVDALITKNASYDSQGIQEMEEKIVTEKDLESEAEEETIIDTETIIDDDMPIGPIENDVMKCERQVGSADKKNIRVEYSPGEALITSHRRPDFASVKKNKGKMKNRNINLTEEAPMAQIYEDEEGNKILEPMFFEPNFKELVQFKPYYDQEVVDNMIVNDMLDIFQESSPMIVTHAPKIYEAEYFSQLIEEEDETVGEGISVAESSLESSLESSQGELSAIKENQDYALKIDKAIDDLLFIDAADTVLNCVNAVDTTIKIAVKGILLRTSSCLKVGVKSMKKTTKSFLKNLWNIQVIKSKPSLANVSGAAVFTKKFRELNPKKRDLPLVVSQIDECSVCSMSVSSNSYSVATSQQSRRNIRNNKYSRGTASLYTISDASTLSSKHHASRSRGRYAKARTFQNNYVQEDVSRASYESYGSYTQHSIQSSHYKNSPSVLRGSSTDSEDSWSTIYG